MLHVEGKGSERLKAEAGGHRFQRVPPTERKGRVHTSTVTVAVLQERPEVALRLRDEDLEWSTTRGSGAGGQNRNKVESCVVLKHVPTGLTVRVETERSQHQNRRVALALIAGRIAEREQERHHAAVARDRKAQVGSGMRGDKVRTIAMQRDEAVDHATGKRMKAADYLKGRMDDLW